ncbi:hypothetical protein C8Q77DRAFT_1252630 [Trametes polyzona]|nr:hypothetical protein C8Q77DRAFT_1252630 [Trametes polyzona]
MFVNEVALKASAVPVKSVTIFQSWTAEVTRAVALELKAGKNVVNIAGISDNSDPESARITCATADARVIHVVCQRKPVRPVSKVQSRETTGEYEALAAKTASLRAERQVREHEVQLLTKSATVLANADGATDGEKKSVDYSALLNFMGDYVQRRLAAQNAIQDIDAQIAKLEKVMWEVRNARKGSATTTISATIVAKNDTNAELRLTYLVSGVSWKPFYDLHATTAEGAPSADVSMRYCATITQETGEDWVDTTLTLSTATSQAQKQLSVPTLCPLKITLKNNNTFSSPQVGGRFGQTGGGLFGQTGANGGLFGGAGGGAFGGVCQQSSSPKTNTFVYLLLEPQMGAQPTEGVQASMHAPSSRSGQNASAQPQTMLFGQAPVRRSAALFGSSSNAAEVDERDASQDRDRERRGDDAPAQSVPIIMQPSSPAVAWAASDSVTSRSALSVAYHVDGAVSLPSDGEAHRLTVATLAFKAALQYVCVPHETQAAFIVGTVKNTSEYELLAGPVSVFLDGGFVSKTSLEFIAVNESFECVLGVDTALKVTFRQDSKTEHEPRRSFAEPIKTTIRTTTTTISNQHPHAVSDLIVRDAIPLGNEDAKVSVTLRKPAGLAEALEGDEVVVDVGDGEGKEGGASAKVRWSKVVDGKGGEKDGLYEWVCAIPAGKKISLETQCDIKGPSNVDWEVAPRLFG